jgi:hypothetical protein
MEDALICDPWKNHKTLHAASRDDTLPWVSIWSMNHFVMGAVDQFQF